MKVVLKISKNEEKFLMETNQELDVYNILVIGGKTYNVGMIYMNTATVKEISFNSNPKDTKDKFLKCPYCGYEDKYVYELVKDIGETFCGICGRCGSDLEYERLSDGYIVKPKTPTRIIQLD